MKKVLFFASILSILFIAVSCGCHMVDSSSSEISHSSSNETSLSSTNSSSSIDSPLSRENSITSIETSVALT